MTKKPKGESDVFVGMDIGYGDEQTVIKLIDKVEDYVNLIILESLPLTNDTEALTRVCDYLYKKTTHHTTKTINLKNIIQKLSKKQPRKGKIYHVQKHSI